jgi:hypothetical protein
LEVQELIIFRDLFASKDRKKSNEYADKLLLKKQDLLNRKKIAAALPNFGRFQPFLNLSNCFYLA